MDKNISIDHQLRATWQAVAKMYNEQAANHESTMATAFVLLTIDKKKGTPSTALGPLMGMEPTSLPRTIKNMEDEGFIVRKPDDSDGRKSIVHLTPLGLEKRDVAKKVVLDFNETVRKKLKESDIQILLKVLSTINKTIEDKACTAQKDSRK